MECPFCEHPKAHKHSKTSKGCQRYRCPSCQQTFTDSLDTVYYRRQVTPEEIEDILQAQTEGVSLRGIARMSKRSYNTVVDVVRASSQKAQLIHNEEVKDVETDQVIAFGVTAIRSHVEVDFWIMMRRCCFRWLPAKRLNAAGKIRCVWVI